MPVDLVSKWVAAFAIISFDDDDIAVYLDPMLTTATAPFETMGARAVQPLLDSDHIQGEHLVSMPLRVRGSVRLAEHAAARIGIVDSELTWVR